MLCLADLGRLDVYFNNLINMLIENRFREDIDFQIDMKNDYHKAHVLQIDLKKDHYLIIRRYDHAFLL